LVRRLARIVLAGSELVIIVVRCHILVRGKLLARCRERALAQVGQLGRGFDRRQPNTGRSQAGGSAECSTRPHELAAIQVSLSGSNLRGVDRVGSLDQHDDAPGVELARYRRWDASQHCTAPDVFWMRSRSKEGWTSRAA